MIRSRAMLLGTALALALAAGGVVWARGDHVPASVPRPQRIVSLNLCADQLVLALADREQIAGLTRNAADPAMSAMAAKARGLPILRSPAEQVLAIDPDLVVGSTMFAGAIAAQGYRAYDPPFATDLAGVKDSIRATARAVGHPERAANVIAAMDRELATVPRPGRGRVAAYYQRRGFMTGSGTLVDDLMRRVGLANLATRLGKPTLSQLSIEEMVAARPDFLIVETATDDVRDQGTEMLHHPALRDIPRIRVPEAWTVCGSPAYVQAARHMADQIARHR